MKRVKAKGIPVLVYARALGCHRTTVGRELGRCAAGAYAYDLGLAQRAAEESARRPRPRRVDSDARLRSYVVGATPRGPRGQGRGRRQAVLCRALLAWQVDARRAQGRQRGDHGRARSPRRDAAEVVVGWRRDGV